MPVSVSSAAWVLAVPNASRCVSLLRTSAQAYQLCRIGYLARGADLGQPDTDVLGRNVSQGFAARKELNDTITVGSSCIQHALAPIRFGTMMSADHSDLRPANLTTLPHFSVSSAMNLPKSMGESAKGVTPNWASFDPNLRSARAAAISL